MVYFGKFFKCHHHGFKNRRIAHEREFVNGNFIFNDIEKSRSFESIDY
jgi:hypothetical protein